MKKFAIFGIFYLLWQISFVADPQLVEARKWTNRSKSTSSSTYCGPAGCSTSTTVTEHKDNQPRYNPYGYGYAPSGPSSGPTLTWDLRCLFGCPSNERVVVVQQPPPQIVIVQQQAPPQMVYKTEPEPERVAAKPSLPDVSLGRLSNLRNYLDVAQAAPRERIALERAILEISDRKKAEFSEEVLRSDLIYLDRLLRKLKRAHVKEEEASALEDAIDYIETATNSK